MLADLVDLGGAQRAGLDQRRARDPDHPDVVEAEAEGELRVEQELRRHLRREREREPGHALGVRGRLAELAAAVIVQLERSRKRLDRRRTFGDGVGLEGHGCRLGLSHRKRASRSPRAPGRASTRDRTESLPH